MTGTYLTHVFKSCPFKGLGCLALSLLSLAGCSRGEVDSPQKASLPAPVAALVEQTPTPEATEADSPPPAPAILLGLSIEPARLKVGTVATAKAVAEDDVDIRYEWTVNGVSEGLQESPSLERHLVRGDEVILEAFPYRDGVAGLSFTTPMVPVENSAPKYVRGAGGPFTVDNHRFHIVDPDGDSLTYSLKGAPPELRVNPANGALSLKTKVKEGDAVQEYEVTLLAEDGYGGEVRLTFPVSVPK